MIAVFYARYLYSNPGGPVFLAELARRSRSEIQVMDVTPARPAEVRQLANASRVIVIDQSVYNAATWTKAGEFSPYFILNHQSRDHYDLILETLLSVSAAKMFATNFDLHDKRNLSLFNRLRGRVDAISWMFEKRPLPLSAIPPRYRDAWLTDDHDPVEAWNTARTLFPVRVELPFALSVDERFSTNAGATWDVCAAGAPYLTRRIARRSIRRAGLRMAPARAQFVVSAIGVRVLPQVMSGRRASDIFIRFQNRTQRALVRSARTNFVCGGPLSFAVRKFFEIPGARSALVATPCIGFGDYGFRDGINAITVAPEDTGAAVRRLMRADGLRERLIAKAFATVSELHAVERRVTDFIECLNKLALGRLRGAQFLEGRFEIT